MKPIEFSNVVADEHIKVTIAARTPPGYNGYLCVVSELDAVIRELAVTKPTWTFTATSGHNAERDDTNKRYFYAALAFSVSENGEHLGVIKREFVGRTGYKIMVTNKRIMKERERGKGYTTDDPKRAITTIKRMFRPMSVGERVTAARLAADEYMSSAIGRHMSNARSSERVLDEAAVEFIRGPGQHLFIEYVNTQMAPHQKEKLLATKLNADKLRMEVGVLEDIRGRVGKGEAALIIRDGEQYIVRVGDNVQLYDDNTLPANMRAGLGMLKLVEKEHFVEGAGCRVSDEVFVVVIAPDNNVSQGESNG